MTDLARAERLVEAILLTAPAPVSEEALSSVFPDGVDVKALLEGLAAAYRARGIAPVKVGGGWAFRTVSEQSRLAAKVAKRPMRLTKAASETLAVIALFQPVTRAEIERVRGFGVAKGTLDILLWSGLVKPGPRREGPGRPLTWVTTEAFLDRYDLADIRSIPGLDKMRAEGMLDLLNAPAGDPVEIAAEASQP